MPIDSFTSNSGQYAKLNDPSVMGFYTTLDPDEVQRLQRYSTYWKFYLGKHWEFEREDGDPLVKLNYFGKFIDKHVTFLVGRGFETSVPDALEQVTKPFVDEVWRYNNRDVTLEKMALTAGVSGDAFVQVAYTEPTELEKQIRPYSQGKIKISVKSSDTVFPKWNPLNLDEMESVKIVTVFRNDTVGGDGKPGMTVRTFTQEITKHVIIEQYDGESPKILINSLGEIPLVHIKNLIVPGEPYGKSDGHDLVDLQRELNEKSTDISDTIHYHSAPITVITGAKAKQLVRGPREVWSGLPADAKVFTLALESDLVAANTYWDKVKKAMHEIGDVPEGALGQMQAISNTSGVALHMQYGPMLDRRQRKMPSFVEGLTKINYFILRIGALKGLVKTPFDLCEKCGGKILLVDNGRKERKWNTTTKQFDSVTVLDKKCVKINNNTLEPLRVDEVRLKIWREYGFGGELKSVTLKDANEIAAGKVSYWDYASEQKALLDKWRADVKAVRERNATRNEEYANQGVVGLTGTTASADPQAKASVLYMEPEPPPPFEYVQQIPMGEVDVPEEPEEVNWVDVLINPETGEEISREVTRKLVIPTGCEDPTYVNPFDTLVEMNNALPKDQHLDAQLFRVYQANGWADKAWVQDQIPELYRDKREINKRLRAEQTSGLPNPSAQPTWTPGKQVQPITDYTPAPQPGASVPGKGGNPTSPNDPQIR